MPYQSQIHSQLIIAVAANQNSKERQVHMTDVKQGHMWEQVLIAWIFFSQQPQL